MPVNHTNVIAAFDEGQVRFVVIGRVAIDVMDLEPIGETLP